MRTVPVEDARKQLGKLVSEAAAGVPVTISRRGTQQAILLGEEEYERLRHVEEQAAVERFERALSDIPTAVQREGIPATAVEEALLAVRGA